MTKGVLSLLPVLEVATEKEGAIHSYKCRTSRETNFCVSRIFENIKTNYKTAGRKRIFRNVEKCYPVFIQVQHFLSKAVLFA